MTELEQAKESLARAQHGLNDANEHMAAAHRRIDALKAKKVEPWSRGEANGRYAEQMAQGKCSVWNGLYRHANEVLAHQSIDAEMLAHIRKFVNSSCFVAYSRDSLKQLRNEATAIVAKAERGQG